MNNLNEQLRENADVIYFSEKIVMCQQKSDIIQTKTIKERTYIICFLHKTLCLFPKVNTISMGLLKKYDIWFFRIFL